MCIDVGNVAQLPLAFINYQLENYKNLFDSFCLNYEYRALFRGDVTIYKISQWKLIKSKMDKLEKSCKLRFVLHNRC